jgi:tetratricopeptide (TPR) repeat protein
MTPLRLLPVLLLAACATRSAIDESRYYARLGDPVRAYQVLDVLVTSQLAAGGTIDETLAEEHQRAYRAMLLARAEQQIFQEREDLALGDLAELDSLEPGYPGVDELRRRAQRKRAQRILERGDDMLRRKDYAQALTAFVECLAIYPNGPAQDAKDDIEQDAKDGIEEVRAATSRMSRRAQEQFLEAVRKVPELRFVEVQWHTANALHNVPDREEAQTLQDKARRENAQKAIASARAAEREAKFGAALMEYKAAHRFDPTVPGLDESIAAMEKEVQAAALVDTAQIDMRAARFDVAHEKLAHAFELSTMGRNDIAKLVRETRRMQGEHEYQKARDLEVLGRKIEALAAFEALAKDWPEGVADERARIDGLRVDIEGAEKEWAEAEAAEAAGDLPRALEHYRNAQRFCAGFRDVKERIEKLRAATTPPGGGEGSTGG